jgi:hypothetical protein
MSRVALALAACVLLARPAVAGPPWISVEIRARHGGAEPFLIIRTFHHGTPVAYPLRGTAVGLVAGRRTELPLRFEPLPGESNAFQVAVAWSAGAPWVLNFTLLAEHMGAGAVVGIGADGEPAFVRYPRTLEGITRPATDGEVDACLQALSSGREPPRLGRGSVVGFVLRNRVPAATLASLSFGLVLAGAWSSRRIRLRRRAPQIAA